MRVAVVIPARDEAERVGETVRAAREVPGVYRVLVVDDGSRDATAARAREAGAEVLRLPGHRGKGAALEAGVRVCAEAEAVVFLDADLGSTARHAGALVAPLESGEADVTVAVLPSTPHRGGFGLAKGAAAAGILWLTGRRMTAPMSGQRALTQAALREVLPLESGWGVEVGMTVDALRAGLRVMEVPVPFRHRLTGRDLPGMRHRFAQLRGVLRAIAVRAVRRR